jgi:hypothetical protein
MKETEILAAANVEPSEHYEAINNLRVLNKFNFEVISVHIDLFSVFIVREIMNLRSNNSKNALTLMVEFL